MGVRVFFFFPFLFFFPPPFQRSGKTHDFLNIIKDIRSGHGLCESVVHSRAQSKFHGHARFGIVRKILNAGGNALHVRKAIASIATESNNF